MGIADIGGRPGVRPQHRVDQHHAAQLRQALFAERQGKTHRHLAAGTVARAEDA